MEATSLLKSRSTIERSNKPSENNVKTQPPFLVVLAMLLLFGACAWAQEFRATLVGRVMDPSNAAVPGAAILLTQRDTNVQHRAVTTETGDYTIPFLPPGQYRLEVERAGFRKYVRDGISLRIQDRLSVDVALSLGVQAETVTVSGDTPMLETSTASLGQVVSRQTVEDTPLNGGNPYFLMTMVPGVVSTGRSTSSFFLRSSATGIYGTAEISISGAPAKYNEYLLDGVPITGGDNGLMYVPPVEATQEFKMQTNSFDAEFGRFLGGVVNTSMRSGTNQFHGAAFEFMRNSVLNARDFFATSKPQFAYNQFGASAGGPVYIPGLYKGKDRTFFFFIYDGSREGVPRSYVSTVPTALERSGDFSQTFARLGSGQAAPVVIYDPDTTRASGSAFVRDPFAGNVIPASRQNPIAKKLLAFYPLPATQGDPVTHVNNYPLAYTDPVLDNGIAFKVDHRFSDRHQMFVRYSWRHFYCREGREFLSPATIRHLNYYSPGVAIDDTLTVNPTTVLNLRYGLTRYHTISKSDSYGFDVASLGWPASLVSAVDRPAIPQVSLSGYTGYGSFSFTRDVQETHFAHAGLLKQKGRHALRAGIGTRLNRRNNGPGGTASGSYSFDRIFTRGPNPQATSATAGNGVASMLLGLGSGGSMNYDVSIAQQTPYYEIYSQDDIRLSTKLTLNLGVRYEWEGAHTERFNRFNRGFDFSVASPIAAAAIANYARSPIPEVPASQFSVKGGLLFAGQGGLPRGLTDTDRNNFSPRVGFAYSLTPKTVLRGGYGHFYGPTTPEGAPTYGFGATTTWVTSLDGGLTPTDTLSNPFPSGIARPVGAKEGLLTYVGQGISFVNSERQQLWTQQFQFAIQRQLPGQVMIETAYSGTRTNDYPVSVALNATPREFQLQARQIFVVTNRNVLNDSVSNPFLGLIAAGSLSRATTTRGQLMRPFPQFTGVSETGINDGATHYDSFQAKVNKRFSGGLAFLVSYTLSKSLQQISYLNETDTQLTQRLSSFDIPQRLAVSGSYQLPFGKGRTLFGGSTGLTGKLLQGWQLNWVYAAQSGIPLAVSSGESVGRSAKLPKNQQTPQRWFDTSVFRLRETLEFVGTSCLPDVRTQGRNNLDLSLYKDTQIFERLKLQFRAESFNLANRTEFGPPGMGVGSSSFGVISGQINFSRQLQFGLRLLW